MSGIELLPEESKRFEEWIYSTLVQQSDNNPDLAEQLKVPMKVFLGRLVDSLELNTEVPQKPKVKAKVEKPEDQSILGKLSRKISSPIKGNGLSHRKYASMSAVSLKKPVNGLEQSELSREEQAHFSEFTARLKARCQPFGKEKRNLDLSDKRSPGPAYYDANKSTLNERPAIIFDKDHKVTRDDFLKPEVENPSPDFYYPSKHFLSNLQ